MLGVGGLGLALSLLLYAQRTEVTAVAETAAAPSGAQPAPSSSSPASPVPAAQSNPEAEKIVYTFPDDEKMREFLKLWQQRQGTVVRMTVLQAYWSEEQAALMELNKKLASDYSLDVTKNYTLDDKRRVIIELPTQPAAPGSGLSSEPGATPATTPPPANP